MRMHRAYRWLAELLARRGHSVLRFDYPGLGNSAGEMMDQTIDSWIDAARAALAEVSELCGPGARTLIGARMGTVVAANACIDTRVDNLVLWEPRATPATFIDEMQSVVDAGVQSRANFIAQDGTLHFNGFPFSVEFLDSLHRCRFADLDLTHVRRILVISSEPEGSLDTIIEQLRKSNDNVDVTHVEGLRDWNTVDQIGGIFLPQNVLRTIDNWVG